MIDGIPSYFQWKRCVKNNATQECIDLGTCLIILGNLFPSLREGEISSRHDTCRAPHNRAMLGKNID